MKRIPKPIWEYVMERDKHRCRFCGRPATEVHHVYPRNSPIPDHLGIPRTVSNHHPDNLVAVCHECHVKIHNGNLKIDRERIVKQNQERRAVFGFSVEVEEILEKLRR